jgi:segregation and condensation protein B
MSVREEEPPEARRALRADFRPEFQAALEALLFVTAEPVSVERLLAVFDEGERAEAGAALEALRARYRTAEGRGVVLEEVAGGLRIVTAPEYHPYLRRFFDAAGANRLSMAALETLAIVAYRQPVTAPEIQDLRSKNSATALKTLLERRMIRISGRKEVVGRPFLYATTREFLMHFGLRSLAELPPLEEFEEAFGGGEETPVAAREAISHQHETIGLVSTGEAEAALGSRDFEVHAHGLEVPEASESAVSDPVAVGSAPTPPDEESRG